MTIFSTGKIFAKKYIFLLGRLIEMRKIYAQHSGCDLDILVFCAFARHDGVHLSARARWYTGTKNVT